jgi:hypothetical protein
MAGQTVTFGAENSDVYGRLKTTQVKNIFDANFQYGLQPLRWEVLTVGGASVTHLPNQGGARMRVSTASGDIAIRQSRAYHQYQPGKTMRMASAVLFSAAIANQSQAVGFFDETNGVFFRQLSSLITAGNPFGMSCVIRSDIGGTITEIVYPVEQWTCDSGRRAAINWNSIQMIYIEYSWYGAGGIRWGVTIDGRDIPLHEVGWGNGPSRVTPYCRTGDLPCRYELRNTGAIAAQTDMIHWGVAVLVDGGQDEQRGFTYSYGMALQSPRRTVAANTNRFPVLSIRNRVMGTLEATQATGAITAGTTSSITVAGTPWTAGQWVGRFVSFPAITATARITANTANTLTFGDVVTGLPLASAPAASSAYTIGLLNRGAILPRRLLISTSAICQVELFSSIPTSPLVLTGSNFQALSALGSPNSFAERDVSSTALSGGEVVMKFTGPAGGSGLLDLDLSYLFPLYNTIRGQRPDILTVAVTTPSATACDVGADFVGQELTS